MDSLRRALASIQKYLGSMSATHKLMVGLIAVVAIFMVYLVLTLTSKPQWVEVGSGLSATEQTAAAEVLRNQNIEHRVTAGKLVVPPDQEWAAKGALAEAGRYPQDISVMFKNTLEKQTWYTSRHQSEQYMQLDLDSMLSRLVSNFNGVSHATVVIDAPAAMGLGAAVRRATASVSVSMRNNAVLSQATVDAIAGLLSGAKAGLEVSNIKVIDASTGRQRRPTRDDEMLATTYLEHAKRVEDQMQGKLYDLLRYINGATVAVTAQVDVTSMTGKITKNLALGDGSVSAIKKETNSKTTQADGKSGAEPGPRSNQAADISRSNSGKGTKLETETTESEFDTSVGTEVKNIVDPRGMPTSLVASVNVPRGYIISLLKPPAKEGEKKDPAKPDAAPTDQEIEARFKVEQTAIVNQVKPHLRTRSGEAAVEGEVIVSLVPGDFTAMPISGGTTAAMSGLGIGTIAGIPLGGGLIDKAVVGVLSIAALTMMVMMVKKAGKKIELPTAEELVGAPPNMDVKSDLIGEAAEGETPLEGIEVDEGAVQKQKMLESVGEFVQGSPEGAAKLVKRWLQTNE